jgi:hypothetical protein
MALSEIYASAAGDPRRIAKLKTAGYPPTLREALADPALLNGKLPKWPYSVPPTGTLPGERHPLQFGKGREHPVTEAEALGLVRRRRRLELVEKYAATVGDAVKTAALLETGAPRTLAEALSDVELLPAELPPWTASKGSFTLRLPTAGKALMDASAELAGSNFTTMTELLWWQYLKQAPLSPAEVEDLLAEYLAETLGADRAAEQPALFRPKRR